MLDVKDAVNNAYKHFLKLIEEKESDIEPLLEEVEFTEDQKYWLITLSFNNPSKGNLLNPYRDYKTITINSETGEFVSMKIRTV